MKKSCRNSCGNKVNERIIIRVQECNVYFLRYLFTFFISGVLIVVRKLKDWIEKGKRERYVGDDENWILVSVCVK